MQLVPEDDRETGHVRYINIQLNMAPRLSGQTYMCCVVFFISLHVYNVVERLKKYTILTRKPWRNVTILIQRAWHIEAMLTLNVCRPFSMRKITFAN